MYACMKRASPVKLLPTSPTLIDATLVEFIELPASRCLSTLLPKYAILHGRDPTLSGGQSQ